MTDAEKLRDAAESLRAYANTTEGHDSDALSEAAEVESIATKYEQMAGAVMEAWVEWAHLWNLPVPTYATASACHALAAHVCRATNKHPSEWTRETLMKELGVSDGE